MHKTTIPMSKIHSSSVFLLIMFSMFPYLKTSSLDTDIQPHSILIFFFYYFIIFLLTKDKFKIHNYSFNAIVFASIFFILLVLLSASLFDYFRILFFFFYFFLFLKISTQSLNVVHIAITSSVIIYFLGALAQIIFGLSILEPFVSNLRFSETRGLTSFTSEPSFFGLVSLMQILVLEIIHQNRVRVYQTIAFINLLLSGSLFVFLPAMLILILYFLTIKRSLLYFVLFSSIFIAGFYVINSLYPDLRAIKLINILLENPDLLINDVSMQNRLLRSFSPIYLSFMDYFQPHNFLYLSEELASVLDYYEGTDDLKINRLSNILTYLIYPFGYFGTGIVLYYIYKLYQFKVPYFIIFAAFYYSSANITIITPYAILLLSIIFSHYRIKKSYSLEKI